MKIRNLRVFWCKNNKGYTSVVSGRVAMFQNDALKNKVIFNGVMKVILQTLSRLK